MKKSKRMHLCAMIVLTIVLIQVKFVQATVSVDGMEKVQSNFSKFIRFLFKKFEIIKIKSEAYPIFFYSK
jgi:hypothetical protein